MINMLLKCVVIFCLIGIPLVSNAFKINSHLWIGAQVIEDVTPDGKVSIPPFGDYVVAPDIVNALRQNPKAYLYGNIGPDFFPDVIAGQTAIHPGAEVGNDGSTAPGAWNSDDWFRYLLSTRSEMTADELAFTYGFLAHGAADFWAHTYVNTYSGNIFDLLDGDGGEAEVRHFVLEGFIGKYTPELIRANGSNAGKGIQVLNTYPGKLPTDFILKRLFLDDEIQDQIDTAPHIKLAASLDRNIPRWLEFVDGRRDPLYKLVGDLFEKYEDDIASLNGAGQDAAEDLCNAPPESLPNGYALEVAADLGDAVTEINREANYTTQAVMNESLNTLESADRRLHELATQYQTEAAELVSDAYGDFARLESDILNTKQSIEQKIIALDSSVRAKSCEVIEELLDVPLGIHEYLVDHLPFANELSDFIFDDLGLPDPLGLGGSSSSREPKVEAVTGNKAYFEQLIQAKTVELADLNANMPNNSLPSSEREYAAWEYKKRQASEHIRIYRKAIDGLEPDAIATVYHFDNGQLGRGFSVADIGGWFCSSSNGFIDNALTTGLNQIHSLEKELVRQRNDLVAATERLRVALLDAANTVYTVKHQVAKQLQTYTNDIMNIGVEILAASNQADRVAELSQEFKTKAQAMIADMCSDTRKVQEFIDGSALESAPFVGSYLLDYFATMYGYDAEDGALYIEWLYFFLRLWDNVVGQANLAYIEMQADIVDILLDSSKDFSDIEDRIQQYMICEAPKMVGVGEYPAKTLCIVQASVNTLMEAANSVKKEADRAVEKYMLGIIPKVIKDVKDDIDAAIEDAIFEFTMERLAGHEAVVLLQQVREGGLEDPVVVNSLFSTTNNNYLVFNEYADPFTERVKAEMHVKNGAFDPERFAPVYNAVVLAKLSLLSADELNRLVNKAGGHSNRYGANLFDGSDADFNILVDAVRTLDGDHQWLEETPRYIRQDGPSDRVLANTSYHFDSHSELMKGFRLYQDDNARNNVFNKIFIGPVNAAIEAHYDFGFLSDLIPDNYPYKPCPAFPFPNGEGDPICMISWMLPVLGIMK